MTLLTRQIRRQMNFIMSLYKKKISHLLYIQFYGQYILSLRLETQYTTADGLRTKIGYITIKHLVINYKEY